MSDSERTDPPLERIKKLSDATALAAKRGHEEFAEGWSLDECPYSDDGEMRTAWINAWCDSEDAENAKQS